MHWILYVLMFAVALSINDYGAHSGAGIVLMIYATGLYLKD